MEDILYICALSRSFLYKPMQIIKIIEILSPNKKFDKEGISLFYKLPINKIVHIAKKENCREELILDSRSNEILNWASDEVNWCKEKGIQLIPLYSEEYPCNLKECSDPPILLYYKGIESNKISFNNSNGKNSKIISIVGTRLASAYGKESCNKIVSDLANFGCSPIIVSGLAYGIDYAAHKASLDNNLLTIGVLPNGLDLIYPAKHRAIAKQIIKQGALITEFPRGMLPLKINFIKRNRIIAGIADAVVVIETRIKGGAMSTVEFANSYSREVFALPGRIFDTNSYGCNYLILKNMARILNNSDTILESIGLKNDTEIYAQQPNLFDLSLDANLDTIREKVINEIRIHPGVNLDELCNILELNISDVSMLLLSLELEKVIITNGAGYCLNKAF